MSHPCEVNINPLPPMGDKDRYQYNIKKTSDENQEKYHLGDY